MDIIWLKYFLENKKLDYYKFMINAISFACDTYYMYKKHGNSHAVF